MCQVSNVTQKLKKSKIKLAVDKKGKNTTFITFQTYYTTCDGCLKLH